MNIPQTVKNNAGKAITVTSIVAVLGLYTGLQQMFDQRYALAEEFHLMQQQIIHDDKQQVKDRIELIEVKEADGVATKYEILEKKQLLRRLAELGVGN